MADEQSRELKRTKAEDVLSARASGRAAPPADGVPHEEVSPKAKKPKRERSISAADFLAGRYTSSDDEYLDQQLEERRAARKLAAKKESPGSSSGGDPSIMEDESEDEMFKRMFGFSPCARPPPALPAARDEENCSGPGDVQPSITEEFGDEMADNLACNPPVPALPTAKWEELLAVSVGNPGNVREWLLPSAIGEASDCDCPTPLPRWDKADPSKYATCGRQQAFIVSQVDIQAVLDRQKQRGGKDDVPYILARTVRSCLQYNAALDIGCRGPGSQCLRGPCFKRAMSMFAGDNMEGVPKEVVLALLKN